jgi:hypothetical protein
MPLPAGVQLKGSVGMELIPAGDPIVHRTFMADVGPRAILAGYPEKLHVAFDANIVRLAKVWRGRFFDAAGVASGRTDQFLGPLGEDLLELPAGPAFALLPDLEAPWPRPGRLERNTGGQFRGYALDPERRPIFRYDLNTVEIEEQPLPLVQPGGAILVRRFQVRGEASEPLYFLAAAGVAIQAEGEGAWRVDGQWQVLVRGEMNLTPILRQSNGRQELLLPVPLKGEGATFETVIKW